MLKPVSLQCFGQLFQLKDILMIFFLNILFFIFKFLIFELYLFIDLFYIGSFI